MSGRAGRLLLLSAALAGGCSDDGSLTPEDGAAGPVDGGADASFASRWTVIRAPREGGANLFGLWGDGPDRLFAVGSGGTILRATPEAPDAVDRDGRALLSFAAMESGVTADLTDVSGVAANEVYAVGLGGTILRYDGSSWRQETPLKPAADAPAFTADLWGVYAYSGGAVAVGKSGYWTRRVMGTWQLPQKLPVESLASVWGTAPNSIWAVGAVGYIFFFNGTSWAAVSPAGFTTKLGGVFGSAANNVFAVGLTGSLLRNAGGGFIDYAARIDPKCGTGSLPRVFWRDGVVTASSAVVLVGWEGAIARVTEGPCPGGGMGIGARDETGATDRRLEAAWGQTAAGKTTIYVAGVEGVVLRGD